MDLKERQNTVITEESWYYRSKLIPVLRTFDEFLSKVEGSVEVVDFGAGMGFFGSELAARFPERVQCVHLVDIGYSEEELGAVLGTKLTKTRFLPELDGNVFVMLMDVLEHVEDDAAVLQSVLEAIPAQSHVFITVPAFRRIWSRHDEVLGHHRRYRLSELCLLCESKGLELKERRYLYGLIFPVVCVVRWLRRNSQSEQSDMQSAHPLLNRLLLTLCGFEMHWIRSNRWFGVSAMVGARKI